MRELRIEKDKERREVELERRIKEVEWKAVRKRRRQEGKRERGEGECFGGNKRECEEKEEMVSEMERVQGD